MSAEIKQIVERRWTYPGDRETSWSYTVYYASGKRVQYNHHKNLPNGITLYLLEADSAEVSYCEGWSRGAGYTIKKTVFTKKQPEKTEPKAKREQPVRVYSVTFTIQRSRVLSNLEYLAAATNKDKAIEQAREKWYANHDPHMFHCEAKRLDKIPEGRELYTFKVLSARGVTWGRR